MKLQTEHGILSLPRDFSFDMHYRHPFFSDEGASTIPAKIKASPENLAILDTPTRLACSGIIPRTHEAILSHGPIALSGKILTSGVESGDDISLSFITGESEVYAGFQDKPLKEIFASKISNSPSGTELYLHWHMTPNQLPSGLTCFSVAVEPDDFGFKTLNEADKTNSTFKCAAKSVDDGDGNTMNYPANYGLTVFPYLYALLDEVFALCGYKVIFNAFCSEPYNSLVVLNNCADTLVKSTFSWSDIVPSMTMGELLLWIKDKFGAFVVIKDKQVQIHLLESSFDYQPAIDLTAHVRGRESISFPQTSSVAIDCDTSLDGAAPPVDMSIEEYCQKHHNRIVSQAESYTLDPDLYEEGKYSNYLTFDAKLPIPDISPVCNLRTGEIRSLEYACRPGNAETPEEDRDEDFEQEGPEFYSKSQQRLGLATFMYKRSGTVELDERSTDDRYCPDTDDGMVFIGEIIHNNTSISNEEEKSTEQKMQICWEMTGAYRSGVSYRLSENEGVFPLSPDGIYHMFWRKYNHILRSSAPEIAVRMDMPVAELLSIDLSKPALWKGIKVFIKEYSIAISADGISAGEFKLLPILPVVGTDSIDDKDVFNPGSYKWQAVQYIPGERIGRGIQEIDKFPLYTAGDAPSAAPNMLGQVGKSRIRIAASASSPYDQFGYVEMFLAVFK